MTQPTPPAPPPDALSPQDDAWSCLLSLETQIQLTQASLLPTWLNSLDSVKLLKQCPFLSKHFWNVSPLLLPHLQCPQQMQNAQDATGTSSPDAPIAVHSEEVVNVLEEVPTESEDFSEGNR
ncbi:hypothetical protein E4T56_gene13204 [Termitomyces sp. T112]|nr:hypothetical protein E4T56_gene13204 [Termitomyces sp. T112]